MVRKKGVERENTVDLSGTGSPELGSGRAGRFAKRLGCAGLILAVPVSCTATLALTEVTPLAGKESSITTTEKRPPTVTELEKDETIPMTVAEADVSTQVGVNNARTVQEGVPFADQLNKAASAFADGYSRTFNKEGGNPVIATIAASGESEVITSLDAPRGATDDPNQETVVEVVVPSIETRISENRALKDDAFGGSVSPGAGRKKIVDVFREIMSGEDITTNSESMRIMMDTTAKETANQALIDKCLREDGPAKDQLLKFSEDSLKKRMVKNFSQFNPDEPPITVYDVKVTWGKKDAGGESALVVKDDEREAYKKNHEAFVRNLEDKGFKIEQEHLMSGAGCQVSTDAAKIEEAIR